jgi:hypothetical protein
VARNLILLRTVLTASCNAQDCKWRSTQTLARRSLLAVRPTGYRVYFPGVKRPGRGVDHTPASSARVKERV